MQTQVWHRGTEGWRVTAAHVSVPAPALDTRIWSSSRVPMVEPTTRSCRKNTLLSSAAGASPLVAPQTTMVPPGRRDLTECAHVASPTVSITASTRSGSRAPDSKA